MHGDLLSKTISCCCPQVIFLLNGGSVAVETLIKHSNVAVIEAF